MKPENANKTRSGEVNNPSTEERSRLFWLSWFKWEKLSAFLYPIASIVLLLGTWEVLVKVADIPLWLLPKPSDFLARLYIDYSLVMGHAWATSKNLITGFLIGVLIAVPLALMIVSIKSFERGLYPIVVFLNIMPKTIIAPILVVWFGIGPAISVTVVVLMCLFPVLVDSMTGFRSVDPRLFYITRSMGANTFDTFFKIRLPASMNYIFSGMKIGIVKAAEGVIIAEFIASNKGLGFMMMQATGMMDMTLVFSGLVAASVLALVFNIALAGAERFLIPWAQHSHN